MLRSHTLSQWWLASLLFNGGISTNDENGIRKSQRIFLNSVIHASGSAGAPTRSLAVAAVTQSERKSIPI